MTKAPELEHRKELKWVLRNIKKELLHAGPDNLVDFNASRLTNSDSDAPSLDAIYKHLKDIERATVISIVERYDGNGIDDVYAYSLDAGAGVTGYKFIVDREKFETFYHAMVEVKIYMKDLSGDDAVDFEEEKKRIGEITDTKDYNLELARWRWFKQVLDSIFVQLSPNGAHGQTVRRIDISKVPENVSKHVLDDLWDRGICGYAGGAPSLDWERLHYRQGTLILVKDLDRFLNYRNGVSNLIKIIDRDGVKGNRLKKSDVADTAGGLVDQMRAELGVMIADIGTTELLTLLHIAIVNFSDADKRLALYLKYHEWDRRTYKALLKPKYLDYYNEWMAVKFFQPRNRQYEFPQPINKYADDPRRNREVEEKRDEIINDLNDLKSVIKEKIAIIGRFKKAHPDADAATQKKDGAPSQDYGTKKLLKSIHLITDSVAANKAIFLVLDERFEAPIRREARNNKGGDTFIKKLHNIAYITDAPGKRVSYNKNLANDINNGLFRIPSVAEYMKASKFEKPTLVAKSADGTLVLKNEIVVKTGLIHTAVPSEHRTLYIDKTK